MACSKPFVAYKQQKPMCRVSPVYDDKHYAVYGDQCYKKHLKYFWRATKESKGTIVADSICKWVRALPLLDCQSIPGLKLETAKDNIINSTIVVEDYEFCILHLGTNNLSKLLPREYHEKLMELTRCIQERNHYTTFGISSVLPRPKDDDGQDDYRRGINSMVKTLCRNKGFHFLKSWSSVEVTSGVVRDGVYAEDDLHLNENGIIAMKEYFEGALGGMMEVKYRLE